MKTTTTYWNPLADIGQWEEIEGTDGSMRQVTVAEDPKTGDYTRLTWFRDGYDTQDVGPKSHAYPEEIFIVSGRIFDEAFGVWMEPGTYGSRPPGEVHGPFRADGDVVVLEISYPGQGRRDAYDTTVQ
jgi:hypothetical protein